MGKTRSVSSGQLYRYDNRICPKCGKPRRLHPDGPTKCPATQGGPPIPEEVMRAVAAFRLANGPEWRTRLRQEWKTNKQLGPLLTRAREMIGYKGLLELHPEPSPPTTEGAMTEKRITLQCRMSAEDLKTIDDVARWHNVPDRTSVIKLVFTAERRRIEREKARLKKIEESED